MIITHHQYISESENSTPFTSPFLKCFFISFSLVFIDLGFVKHELPKFV